jgi:hypothetical protein
LFAPWKALCSAVETDNNNTTRNPESPLGGSHGIKLVGSNPLHENINTEALAVGIGVG